MFKKLSIGYLFLLAALPLNATAQGTIMTGFQMQPWLSNAGDLRGVTVGPGGSFGQDPFVYSFSQQAILRVTGIDSTQQFATGFGAGTGRIVFDASGSFGNSMFVAGPFNGAGPNDPIYRVTSSGSVSIFNQGFNGLTKGIAFGTGTSFGDSLFVVDARGHELRQLNSAGSAAAYGGGVTSDSWEDDMVITSGNSFGEYAYILDGIHNQLLRMPPNGLATEWTLVQGGLSLALGDGVFGNYLYVGTAQGNIFRVDPQGNLTTFASGFGEHTLEGNLRGLAIAGDVMWATSDTGTLYRITPVPEPATYVIAIASMLSALIFSTRPIQRLRA